MQFVTGGSERMRITSSGNVGIGTTPTYLLDVNRVQTMSRAVDRALQVRDILTYSGTGSKYQQSIFASARHLVPTGSNNTGYLRGMTFDVTTGFGDTLNSGSLSEITGMQFNVGIESIKGNAPTVTNVTGLNIWPFYQAGSVTNLYALKLQTASTGGSVTNYYGIYQEDANAKNYFNGDVGIGTTEPSATLHVKGATEGSLIMDSDANGAEIIYFKENGTSNFYLGVDGSIANNPFTIYDYASGTKVFNINNGNVGIGTSTPEAKFHVSGSGNVEPIVEHTGNTGRVIQAIRNDAGAAFQQGVSGSNNSQTYIGQTGTSLAFMYTTQYSTTPVSAFVLGTYGNQPLILGTNNTNRLHITNTGNVGIGTSSPQSFANLQVKTATDRNAAFFDNASGVTLGAITDAGSSATLRLAGNPLVFTGDGGSGAEHMRINSSGNVGIGTTNPTQKLEIDGNIKLTSGGYIYGDGSNADLSISNNGGSVLRYGNVYVKALAASVKIIATSEEISLQNNNGTIWMNGSGNVGIGTSSPDSKLEVNGSATNTNSINTSSDTINYSLSNIAYTSSTSGTITLTNIKDGGAYTLISTATSVSTEVSFTVPTGFSIIGMGTVPRTINKRHIYSFIVAGSIVYVTMGTEN
jgi:hypothetical protein